MRGGELKGGPRVRSERLLLSERRKTCSRRCAPRGRRLHAVADLVAPRQPRGLYSESHHYSARRPTRTVWIGDVPVGSDHPIVEQTMTTADTRDVDATVDEVMRCADAGAKMVRCTVQGPKEADACPDIKDKLLSKGYDTPLVADIHFAPRIALRVADAFDKVRINPGNFYDGTKKFEEKVYDTPAEYRAELEKIEERFSPLVEKCKSLGRAMRIGTNHGSLSARILSVYGDTPAGMVESAFEFARVCRKHDFHNFLFSMKASNPLIMVQAYRLLSSEMYKEGWDYPLHLGVTEAGEGEDGRMKSALGIGALLMDGLGDTIRVSLTEDPEYELEPCRNLKRLGERACSEQWGIPFFDEKHRDFESYEKRSGDLPMQQEGDELDFRGLLHRDGSVLASLTLDDLDKPDVTYAKLGYQVSVGIPVKDLASVDSVFLHTMPDESETSRRTTLTRLQESGVGVLAPIDELNTKPLRNAVAVAPLSQIARNEPMLMPESAARLAVSINGTESNDDIAKLIHVNATMVLLNVCNDISRVHASRRVFEALQSNGINLPVIHQFEFDDSFSRDDLVIQAGTFGGALLMDGLGDGVMLDAPSFEHSFLTSTAFNLLQGSRMRNTKTEFVSCPSCGRTLFDLQEVTDQIRQRTGHLPGVSIAVMGCIVNGPGEMADADFGYVGSKPGKIDLYVGKEVVQRDIDMDKAPDALVDLIKAHGRWVDPPEASVNGDGEREEASDAQVKEEVGAGAP